MRPRASESQQEKPRQLRPHRAARESPQRNKGPAQPKVNKYNFFFFLKLFLFLPPPIPHSYMSDFKHPNIPNLGTDGTQGGLPPGLPKWHIDYFEFKLLEKQLVQERPDPPLSPVSRKQAITAPPPWGKAPSLHRV